MRIEVEEIQKRITVRDDRSFGIINYDTDNAYPQRVEDIVNGSSTAKNCIKIFRKFIKGDGFQDLTFSAAVINDEGVTIDQLQSRVVDDFAELGFAIHFNYNILGERVEANYIPFSHCRLGIPGEDCRVKKIHVYNDWGRASGKPPKKDKIDIIDVYNPNTDIVKAQIMEAGGIENYKGQIYYYGKNGDLIYPLATIDAELEDAETDSQISLFKYRNISGSFMASHMLVTYGQYEDESPANTEPVAPTVGIRKNPDGVSQREMFKQKIKTFQGAKNFNRVMHLEITSPEEKPELIPFTHQNSDKLFEWHENSTKENIRRNFTIPTIFLDAVPGSLGLNTQLEDAIKFYNIITYSERKVITEQFKKLFGTWKPVLNPSGNYELIELTKI